MLTRKKLGILVNNLGPSQLSFEILIRANKYSNDLDFVLFYQNLCRPCFNLTSAAMQINEIYSFPGPAIATDLSTANTLIAAPSPVRKYFYVWDLEWIRMPQKNYESLAHIYQNPELQLIARSGSHKKLLENCWNRTNILTASSFDDIILNNDITTQQLSNQFLTYGRGQKLPDRPLY